MAPNKLNIYDYILSMGVSKDILRPNVSSIFPNAGYYCASDSAILIVAEKEKLGGEYLGAERHPTSAIDLILNHSHNETYHYDRTDFLSCFFSAELQWGKKYKPCEKCSGAGWQECECCGNEADCKPCNGTGNSDELEKFGYPSLEGEDIILLGVRFHPQYVNIVLQTAFFLASDTITIHYEKGCKNKPFLFEIEDVKILLMPKI